MTSNKIFYVEGDIFDHAPEEPLVMAHGCNMEGVMGAGIARLVKDKFYGAYMTYRQHLISGDPRPGSRFATDNAIIYNLYTQIHPGPNARYMMINDAIRWMLQDASSFLSVEAIRIPLIGAGIGGLTWTNVHAIIDFNLELAKMVYRHVPEIHVYYLAQDESKLPPVRMHVSSRVSQRDPEVLHDGDDLRGTTAGAPA